MLLKRFKKVHFVGVGGVGMCGLAEVLQGLRFEVSGSDLKPSRYTKRLEKLGVRLSFKHDAANLGDANVLVCSSAIRPDNPELVEAIRRGIPVIPRAQMLAELMRLKEGVAVAGSHGKTTTTSLIAWLLSAAGMDPTFFVGGRLTSYGTNAKLGEGSMLVAEADESDGSFLRLTPMLTVVTNIDREHLDHYGTFEALKDAFVSFASSIPFYGVNVLCGDDPVVREISGRIKGRNVTYGFEEGNDFRARHIRANNLCMEFDIVYGGKELIRARVPLPGRHNVLNALAAFIVGFELDIPVATLVEALACFDGVERRFQIRGRAAGVTVVDDYGHHPSEIRATLKAARECFDGPITVLFQPHRYTRTRDLMDDFAESFGDIDRLFVTDIYAASEPPIDGIDSPTLVERIAAQGVKVQYVADKDEAGRRALDTLAPGALLLTLGAGDIHRTGPKVLSMLKEREGEES